MTRGFAVLLGAAILVAAGILYVARAVTLESDYSVFLPAGVSQTQQALMRELREGLGSRVMLIEVRGGTREALAETSRKLAADLAARPQFRYVTNGASTAVERDLRLISEHRYALSDRLDEREPFSSSALRKALEARLDALAGSAGMLEKSFLARDPTGETLRVLRKLVPSKAPQRIDGVWFDAAGERALLLAQTRAFGSDIEGQADAIAALENAFSSARASSAIALDYSSPGAMAVRSRALISGDARTLSIVSLVGVLAILTWAYRSLTVVTLCVLPALCGLLAGVVIVDLAFGSIHGIALAFGATLLGEAVDYPTYVLTQVKEGASTHEVNARIGGMLRLAVLSTVCGAFALLFSGFPGLSQLGMLTVVGVLVAGAATWWVLPHAVPRGWKPRPPPRWQWISGRSRPTSPGWRWGVFTAITICAVALAWGKPWWDDDLASMNPLPASAKANDARLRAALGGPDARYMLAVSAATPDAALEGAEALRPRLQAAVDAGDLGGFDLVTDLLPSQAAQARRRQSLPEPSRLRADLDIAASGLPFRAGVFEPFVAAVAQARDAAPVTAETYAGSALALKIEALLRRDGDRWHVIVPLTDVRNAVALAEGVAPLARLIDLREEVTGMMEAYRERGVAFSGIGLALMYVVLALGLRSPVRAAQVLLPIVMAAVVVAALLVAFSEPLTVFHYVALLLTVGIGVNYALLMASTRAREDPAATWRTLAVVSGTALTTFGILALAHAPVLHAIGVTVSLGVLASVAFASALVHPASTKAMPA